MNTEDIIKRVAQILEHYELSAAQFADKINVQRSSISHLLNGRNKPSLDFVLKVNTTFEDVDLYWLLYGKGVFPHANNQHEEKNLPESGKKTIYGQHKPQELDKSIDRVLIFYKDGTFKSYQQE